MEFGACKRCALTLSAGMRHGASDYSVQLCFGTQFLGARENFSVDVTQGVRKLIML